jgi:hypothetical protein
MTRNLNHIMDGTTFKSKLEIIAATILVAILQLLNSRVELDFIPVKILLHLAVHVLFIHVESYMVTSLDFL